MEVIVQQRKKACYISFSFLGFNQGRRILDQIPPPSQTTTTTTMSLYRLLHRRATTLPSIATFLSRTSHPPPHPHPLSLLQSRNFAFSSAEEAAAERRRRKRRLRIEPPLHALRRDPSAPRPPPDPNAKPLPDTTSSLVGLRLNLHNRIQSLIRAGDLDNAAVLARQAVYSRVRPTVFTCNALVASMYRAKRYDDAVSLFSYFFEQHNIVPNVVSYNFLIATHCDCGRVDVAREYYQKILADAPFSPSAVTFRHLTKGLIDGGRIADAVDMLREMLNKGLGADSLVYNNLIKGFLDLGELDKANELFDELKERCLVYDGVVNATYMDWFFGQGRGKEAMESYRSLLDREFRMTPATCNVLLEVLLRHGKKKEAWELFDSMLDNHTVPTFHAVNSETFNIMVNECFKEGKYDEAVSAFRRVGTKMGSRPFVMDVAGYTNLVVRFVEHGMISEAEEFFSELQTKSLSQDVTCYRTFIDAYLKEERMDDALGMFNKMVDVNLRVIPLYANRWFTELIQSNKAVECSQILTKMGDREVKPDSLTYEIVIKGLVGVGAFDVTVDTVDQMMRYGVAVTPLLRECLLEAFEKVGRKEEMVKLLDERRQVYSQQPHPRPSGPSRPTGVGQSPRPTAENLRPAGTTGYSGPAGATGYSASEGSTGFSASAGVTGYSGQTGPTGYLSHAGRTGYSGQGGPTEYSGQVGPTGYPGQGGPSRYPAQGGPTGYSSQGGPAGYTGQVGPAGYSGQVGPAGYSGQAGPTGHSSQVGYTGSTVPRDSGTVGSCVYTDPPRHTGYPAAGGTSAFQGPAEQMWKAGSTEQIGHSWRAEPPTFQTMSGPGRFPGSDRPEWEKGFQGPAGTSAYPGGQGPTEQADLSGSGEPLRRYSGSGYQ